MSMSLVPRKIARVDEVVPAEDELVPLAEVLVVLAAVVGGRDPERQVGHRSRSIRNSRADADDLAVVEVGVLPLEVGRSYAASSFSSNQCASANA
jgi:hypothetical protein